MRSYLISGGVLLALLGAVPAAAQNPVQVPRRQLPLSVLTEVKVLQNRFEVALANDCDGSRCYPKGCTYVSHRVADRPKSSSLPGLGQDEAPSPEAAQAWLTEATCAFATERTVSERDANNLANRLQNKLSAGWTVVTITHERLPSIPAYLQEPYTAPEPDEDTDVDTDAPVAEPVAPAEPPFTVGLAIRELWTTLLPHVAWMIALLFVTLAAVVLIWAWRRVGRTTLEERMLLAELEAGPGSAPAPEGTAPVAVVAEDDLWLSDQQAAWRERLDAVDPEAPDLELQALIRERLLARDLPLLAKAVLVFPDTFPRAFPEGAVGGELAAAKVELSEYLKGVDVEQLPDDETFFRSLNRHALSATLASQTDASTARTLRDSFGTTGLATLISALPPRPAALLFALAPLGVQHELVRLVEPSTLAGMGDMLLRSNRMSRAENRHLSAVLQAAREERPIPPAPASSEVSDQGEAFDAAGPLSVLLEALRPDRRDGVLEAAVQRLHGSLPDWTRGILISDMLTALDAESRADLLLELEAEPVAGWLSFLDRESRQRVLDGMPPALVASIQGASSFAGSERRLALAERGRRELAAGFLRQLARRGATFEDVLVGSGA